MAESIELADGGSILPAVVATVVWLGVGAALDVYLMVSKRDYVMTDVLRTAPGKVFIGALTLHVANQLGKADPFSATGSFISARLARAATKAADALTDALPGN